MQRVVKYLLLSLVIHATAATHASLLKDESKCFHTAVHYSNSIITGMDKLYISYRNDNFKTVNFDLNCSSTEGSRSVIQLQEVNLLLPLYKEEICVDSRTTNFKKNAHTVQCVNVVHTTTYLHETRLL